MSLTVAPVVRTVQGAGQTGLAVINLNWTAGTVLTMASPGGKSAVLFTQTDGMVELGADAQCWYTIAGVSALGTSAGAGVAQAGSMLMPANSVVNVYVPANSIIGVVSAGSGNLAIIPAILTD